MHRDHLILDLIDAIDVIIIQVDSDLKITVWNKEAEFFFNIPRALAEGVFFPELPIDWDFSLVEPFFSQQLLTEKLPDIPVQVESTLKILGLRILASDNEKPGSRGYIFLGRDITQLKSVEQKLKTDRKMKTIGELSSGIAHEINTPAQFIQSNMEFLQEQFPNVLKHIPGDLLEENEDLRYLSEEIPNAISQSLQGMKTITSITSSMRNYAHPAESRPRAFDLNYVIEESITISKNAWKYVSDLQFNKNENLPEIIGYPSDMHQVFINLIVNASQTIEEKKNRGLYDKGKITIEIVVLKGQFVISVTDNGMGMDESIRNKIFTPFFTTKERGRGSGQGLSIVKNIVEQRHNGHITLYSRPGKGTTFTITIPQKGEINEEGTVPGR